MLLFEPDAKELLAIQGIPIPGGIRLEQVPKHDDEDVNESSGPWIVKPQVADGGPELAKHILTARTKAEIRAAAESLLQTTIEGHPVHSIFVERQFTPRSETSLRFECDWPKAGIRISAGAVAPAGSPQAGSQQLRVSKVVTPDPNAVIAGVNELAADLPSDVRDCIMEAGKMLAPLFFGYEAVLMDITPLMLLSDGGWAVGDVQLAIDENALFRHPELLSLVERRDHAYHDVRQRRRYGIVNRLLNDDGAVATFAASAAYGAFLIDEMKMRGIAPRNIIYPGPAALDDSEETLDLLLSNLEGNRSLRCLLMMMVGDINDLSAFAQRFVTALENRPAFQLPVIARFAGSGAGSAGAILEQARPSIFVEPNLVSALDQVSAHLAERPE